MKMAQAGHRPARVRAAAGLVFASAMVLVASCGGGSNNAAVIKNGGILRVGMTQTIDNLNPFVGFEQVSYDIWETIYLHELSGENPVAEWTKGTALKPLLDALEGDERRAFEAAYRARVAEAYPPATSGRTLFPFRRLFLIAEARA